MILRVLLVKAGMMQGFGVLITGPPAAGKTTLGNLLHERLSEREVPHLFLDGDHVRRSLWPELSFSQADRIENLYRVGTLCEIAMQGSVAVVMAVIAPFGLARENLRRRLSRMLMVYCRCSLEIRLQRDPRGLYRRASRGEVTGLTGYDAPYEEPMDADLVLDTDACTPQEGVEKVLAALRHRQFIPW